MMKNCVYYSISFFALFVLRTSFAAFPSYIKICKHDATLPHCLIENINACMPHLEDGIPELLIPPLHPFQVESIELTNGNLHIKVEDFKLFHMDKFTIENFNLDYDNYKLDFTMLFPFVEQQAKYSIHGKFLLLELNGAGDHYGNASDVYGHGSFTGKLENKGGKDYIVFGKPKLTLDVKGPIYMYFFNLFGENEELTRTTNQVLNENSKEALEEVKEMLEEALSDLFGSIIQHIFLKYSVDELFPK